MIPGRHPRARAALVPLLGCAAWLGACGGDAPPTANVRVLLITDRVPDVEFDQVSTALVDDDGQVFVEGDAPLSKLGKDFWPDPETGEGATVARFTGVPTDEFFDVFVRLRKGSGGTAGTLVVEEQVRARFAPGEQSVEVRIATDAAFPPVTFVPTDPQLRSVGFLSAHRVRQLAVGDMHLANRSAGDCPSVVSTAGKVVISGGDAGCEDAAGNLWEGTMTAEGTNFPSTLGTSILPRDVAAAYSGAVTFDGFQVSTVGSCGGEPYDFDVRLNGKVALSGSGSAPSFTVDAEAGLTIGYANRFRGMCDEDVVVVGHLLAYDGTMSSFNPPTASGVASGAGTAVLLGVGAVAVETTSETVGVCPASLEPEASAGTTQVTVGPDEVELDYTPCQAATAAPDVEYVLRRGGTADPPRALTGLVF